MLSVTHVREWSIEGNREGIGCNGHTTPPPGSLMSPLTVEATAPSAQARLHAVRELNGIRGLAALIVFFAHCLGFFAPDPRWGTLINTVNAVARSFNSWVDIFFVLSGYLITTILLGRRGSPHYFRNFYWRRVLRILPLYCVCLLVVLLFVPHSGAYVLLAAFFMANFNGFFRIAIDGPFWTLAIEEQFYLLWPTVIHHRSVTQLRRLALTIAITSAGLRFALALAGHNDFNLTPFRVDGLAMGAWLACYFHQRIPTPELCHRENRRFTLFLVAGAAIAVAAHWLTAGLRPQYIPRALDLTGMIIAYTGFFGLIIAHHGHAGPQRILRSRFLGFFGLISYAFYMTHLYVLVLYDRWHGPVAAGDKQQYLLHFGITFLITTAVSLASRYLIELPALSLRRLILPPTVPPAETQLPLTQA